MHIVLFEPEIPPNTGNIARLCAGTRTRLHLVGRLGFELTDRYLKRAGLDYWEHVDWEHVADMQNLKDRFRQSRFLYFTTKSNVPYTRIDFRDDDFLVFGPESRGLPEDMLAANTDACYTIPMPGPIRSLNLSTAVGIVVYEGLRQLSDGFACHRPR